MLDFVKIREVETKKTVTIFPEFIVTKSKDLMIRGHAFYAIWDEETNLWVRSEQMVQQLVDRMIFAYTKERGLDGIAQLKLLQDFSSNKWNEWQKYCKSLPDNYHELDEKVIFANKETKKQDYASHTLTYALVPSPIPAYEQLVSTLYEPKERQKLEWGIGSIIKGDSKTIQKFFVLYGGPGTGKSTILNIMAELFDGYYGYFDARSVGSSNNQFALENFRSNPLVSIQHDGDLSRIEDNTKINSIVSHETMMVNEKFKAPYKMKFKTMLFMGTNKPVKITDVKSGLLRRLIDISPTGEKLPIGEYNRLMEQIHFELGGIAAHCLQVYESLGKGYYNNYVPKNMMEVTNDFYIFVEDNYDLFAYAQDDTVTLNTAWMRYKDYCEKANVKYPMAMRAFKTELMAYYQNFYQRYQGQYSVYVGFLKDKINGVEEEDLLESESFESWLRFDQEVSEFDLRFESCPAQYANDQETPALPWDKVTTMLKDLETSKLHYVRVPENLIVVDFDLKDGKEKSYEKNLEAASHWPQTYAELSKSGAGIHLHYFYDGDISELSQIYKEHIEIKVFRGKSSLRRMLTKCNDIPIAHITAGLPLKERRNKMIDQLSIKTEQSLRELIKRNLRKEIHPGTKPSMDFIHKILEDAYNSGLHYDVKDMRPVIQNFAMNSTHQSDYCLRLLSKMKFASEEISECVETRTDDIPIVFFDIECLPNLFLICWKKKGPGQPLIQMYNPKPEEVEELTKFRLIGFNNRNYDNHMIYAAMMGYNNEQLFKLSQSIIENKPYSKFGEAYNLSYTDVYDFLSASNKMSLKKWEIKLGIHHQELGFPWDQPVPEEDWMKVGEYCNYDVIATEAVFDANEEDWMAREILADLAGMTVNDTTNQLSTRLIVGTDKNPQDQFIYPDLSKEFPGYRYEKFGVEPNEYKEGVKIVKGKSIYKGEDPGEGGYVYAQPGIYTDVALLDIASMHPSTIIALQLFGKIYTKNFKDIVDTRLHIKHKEFDEVISMFEGKLAKYLGDPGKAKKLANALKTAINSVYGLTAANFSNRLKDPRNIDNVVAKRGALFMINLKEEIQKRGYTVVHIKTDSIKIANADSSIIQFVMDYGKGYGYNFEHEATYDRICLVNDAVYIAKVREADGDILKDPYWTATGTQFQVPYVFKTLFSKEDILFEDLCETKSVSTALYLDMNEFLSEEEHDYQFVGKVGSFCPMKDGVGGGLLLREIAKEQQKEKRFASATGSSAKGRTYRWMNSEMVKTLGLEDSIDRTYYNTFVDDAIETINKFGDFEWFISDDPYPTDQWMKIPEGSDEELPFPMNEPMIA